jgi:hypothetical protein
MTANIATGRRISHAEAREIVRRLINLGCRHRCEARATDAGSDDDLLIMTYIRQCEDQALRRLRPRMAGHGDGHESERLWSLEVGHVLTRQDVEDIRNEIGNFNDELMRSADLLQAARAQVLRELGGEALVIAAQEADDATAKVIVERALAHFRAAKARAEICLAQLRPSREAGAS